MQNSLDAERRCLVCGDMKPRSELIRFVIAPDFSVVPDLSENLPGRGLWVTASADAICIAAQKNLFAKAAKCNAHPSLNLATDVAVLARKRCLDLLGISKGAGVAVLGEGQTQAALRDGSISLHLRAADAARKLDNRLGIKEIALFSRDEMGAALGYAQIVYMGLMPHGVTKKLEMELTRLGDMLVCTHDRQCGTQEE